MTYECPKTHGRSFVRVAKTYRYEPRAFLLWSWVAEVHDGFIVRCTDCARYWRIGLDGVHIPAGHEVAREQPPLEQRREREREDGDPAPPLGLAVRRPAV